MNAIELIKEGEGLRLKPYQCTAGKTTIGYGRNLDDVGISESEAEVMLANDLAECEADLNRFGWFPNLDEQRQAVLLDMRFNLGPSRFRRFRKMIAAVETGDYERAADEMLDSLWARQVGRRAHRNAALMRNG